MTDKSDSREQTEPMKNSTATQNAASTRRGALAALAGVGLLSVGTGTATADDNHDHVGQSWSGDPTNVLRLENTATTGNTRGLFALANSPDGQAIRARNFAESESARGVSGISDSDEGNGVFGYASHESGLNFGLRGESESTQGTGAYGNAKAESGQTKGVRGAAKSPDGRGISGENYSETGDAFGVFGMTQSLGGTAVKGYAPDTDDSLPDPENFGIHGEAGSSKGIGVYAENSNGGLALQADGDTDISGVLTIGDLGAEAYLDSNQTISNVSDTVAFDTVLTDDREEFDDTNGNFNAEYDGTYLVTTQITWDGSTIGSNQSTSVELVHEGTTVAENVGLAQSGHDYYSLAVSKTLRNVTASDNIRVEVSHEGSDWDLVGEPTKTWVEISQIG